MDRPSLSGFDERLRNAGVAAGDEPFDAWCRLRAVEGRHATVIDLYRLEARRRGLEPHELPAPERHALARRATAVILPGFEVTGSARGTEPVEIVSWDPGWPDRYTQWRERLTRALGPAALRIDHVGSTSVPGLAAKSTIDVQISVTDVEEETLYVEQLEYAGVEFRSRDDEHRYFRPFPGRARNVHVHVCAAGSRWEREHLLFRDYLRAHPQACERYAAVKREAASIWRDDRWGYTDAKSAVILPILDAAETWASVSGWTVGASA